MNRTAILITMVGLALSCDQGEKRPGSSAQDQVIQDFDPQVRADPVRLVREYVERDSRGERLESNAWFDSVVTWPQDPGYDYYTVITSFAVRPVLQSRDSARVEVTYEEAGLVKAGGPGDTRFAPNVRTRVDTFVVERSVDGWRLADPQIEQHVLPRFALDRSALGPQDQEEIRALRSPR